MFEVYTPRTRGTRKEKDMPAIKISKQSIVLNKYARNLVPVTDKLELSFDRESNTIRIKPSEVENGGINMKKTKVFAKGFLDHFSIEARGKFIAEFDENEQAFYVKL